MILLIHLPYIIPFHFFFLSLDHIQLKMLIAHSQLKEALGERRFRAWKLAQEQKNFTSEDSDLHRLSDKDMDIDGSNSLDLTKLITAAHDVVVDMDNTNNVQVTSEQEVADEDYDRVWDAKDRDIL